MAADEILAKFLEEGRLDSSGQLTVDRQSEARKLAAHWGLSAEHVLLLAVQLVHAAGGSGLELQLRPDRWQLKLGLPNPEEIHNGLHDNGPLPPELRDLANRLQLAVLSSSRGFSWSPPTTAGLELSLQFQAHWFSRLFKSGIAELRKTLVRRCSLARLPINLNGQLINTGSPEDCPALAFAPSPWKLQSLYYDSGPWMVESLSPTSSKSAESFLLASGALRCRDACRAAGRDYNCLGPDSPGKGSQPMFPRIASALTVLQDLPDLKVGSLNAPGDVCNPELDVLRQLDSTRQYVLGLRRRLVSRGANSYTQPDFLFYAEGLEDSLSEITHLVKPIALTTGMQINVPCLHLRRWTALRGSDPLSSQLIYVKHGVTLDPVTFPAQMAISAIVADNRVTTDLSGVKVVENDRVRAECRTLEQEIHELLSYLRHYKDPGDCPLGRHFALNFRMALRVSSRTSE